MKKKLIGALAPVIVAAGAMIPMSATPAAADPPCGFDVYTDRISESEFAVNVASNRCGRQVRAYIKCAIPFSGATSYGPVVTSGRSYTMCSRNTVPGERGWEVYENGRWNKRVA
ncbi:hypothetical protein [Streptomyces sp. NPDC059979]|uniref:hypothetical protein n=1 Tax=unclassified Streptomyces TaxID=2593676 RepID=UPI0036660E9E